MLGVDGDGSRAEKKRKMKLESMFRIEKERQGSDKFSFGFEMPAMK